MTKEKTRKDPKEYMKIAVDVMRKSIEERKNDKPSPYVGAVLVFPDGSYDTAYRGELREGDHAEYTLLDKKTDIESYRTVGYLPHLNHVHLVHEICQKSVVPKEL